MWPGPRPNRRVPKLRKPSCARTPRSQRRRRWPRATTRPRATRRLQPARRRPRAPARELRSDRDGRARSRIVGTCRPEQADYAAKLRIPSPPVNLHVLPRAPTVSGGGDGFETRGHSEGSQQMADVVADRLRAQVELLRDLLRRASLLKDLQHLGLAGREVPRAACSPPRRAGPVSSPKTPTTRSPPISGTALTSSARPSSVGRGRRPRRCSGRR